MLVGKAGHEALEMILKGASVEHGIEAGLVLINNVKDNEVKWGKTGSREDVIKTYSQAIQWYLAEKPDFGKILGVEESMVEMVMADPDHGGSGELYTIPAKCISDVISEDANGDLVIHDHKFVVSFTDGEKESGDKYLQALFNYHPVWRKYGRRPKRMIYHELKTSKNKNGESQLQDWVIEFDQIPQYFAAFYKLYDLCSTDISREDKVFLPNISDIMDGEETLKTFVSEIVSVDRPTPIQHKAAEVEFKERKYVASASDRIENHAITDEEKIRLKFQEFGVAIDIKQTFVGRSIIKYTFKPSRGVRMKDFERYEKDIAIALKANSVRIEAPIMGTDLVGIEVPNPERTFIKFDPSDEKTANSLRSGTLSIPVGVDIYGNTVTKDLADMPHLLVAGATGSGKSVFLNVLIHALVAQNTPEEMKLVLIDPKRVELAAFKSLPHILARPIYEVGEALKVFKWLIEQMEYRYETFEGVGARNIDEYNASNSRMDKIVVVIDEFADLIIQNKEQKMQGEPNYTEFAIVRLAQKARAVGIHLVIGTQRPSVDVVTGLIKANIPTRIAFATAQGVDSKVILDREGAENLIGKGDLLFLDPSRRDLQRLQSFYV